MAINKYVGSRYVPLYIGVHNSGNEYEPLSIVSNSEKTETYTSKQYVPSGVSLDNETYWAQSGWSNADLQIEVENAPVVSTDDAELTVERTKSGYLLTLSDSNSFDCGGDYGEAYTLNTMYDVGRYMIKPSICSGVPSQIADIENPAELLIADYTEIDDNIMKQYQKITAFDDDGAASFIRIHNGENWSDWKMIGGGIGMLPIASKTVLGGVKIGEGINITDDGTISTGGKWKDVDTSKLKITNTTEYFKSVTWGNGCKISPNDMFMILEFDITLASIPSVETFENLGKLDISETGYQNAEFSTGGGTWIPCGCNRVGTDFNAESFIQTQSYFLAILPHKNSGYNQIYFSLLLPIFKTN